MKVFSRSSDGEAGTVTRVTGQPGDPQPDPAFQSSGPTPVPSRLARLAAVVDKARPGRAGSNVRKLLQTLGMLTIAFGIVCILLGWYGASHSAYQYQEIPYLISGGLLGVALVIAGGVLIHSAWNIRQIEEDRRNALAVVRSIDRLERIIKSLDESRRTEQEEHSL
jgi:hypothetical protein